MNLRFAYQTSSRLILIAGLCFAFGVPAHSQNSNNKKAPAKTQAPPRLAPERPVRATPANQTHGSVEGSPALRGANKVQTANGEVSTRPAGRGPLEVHNRRLGETFHHNLTGGRRVESVRPDGSRLVSEKGRRGYVGRPYMARGHEFERRTYYDHGRAYDRFYRPYAYHGYNLRVYAPARYYPAAYYGWVYQPWREPVHYGWGWDASPWYGYYGAYFQPYPVYASPALWLTDYAISQTLSSAYQAQSGAVTGTAPAAYSGPAITPEAKQLIANEVQGDIALENQEASINQQQSVPDPASSGIARMMSDGQAHAFVAGQEVDVVDNTGLECAITDGDILRLAAPPAPQGATATVVMMSSKGGKDCAQGTQVQVDLDDLQEMSNNLREQVDAGLQDLASKQGSNGLPSAPPSALAAPSTAVVAVGAPPPDPNVAQELAQQEAGAQAAEQEVLSSSGTAAPAPATNNEDLFKPQR